MTFPEDVTPLTAMKATKEFIQHCRDLIPDADEVPDDDPIYEGYIVILPDNEMTIAPNAEEFFEVFEFVNEETPGEFASIKYKD